MYMYLLWDYALLNIENFGFFQQNVQFHASCVSHYSYTVTISSQYLIHM